MVKTRVQPMQFQSTPPVKAATDNLITSVETFGISIHAAREGGDWIDGRNPQVGRYFNPRRP